MKRKFLIFAAIVAWFGHDGKAQNCYFTPGNTVNCPTNGSQSPDIKTFAGETVTAFQTMAAGMALLPQPKIQVGLQVLPASTTFITADSAGCQGPPVTCVFANATALNSYIDTVYLDTTDGNAPIATFADWNIDPLPYTQAAEYTGSATPPDAAFEAYLLTVQDSVAQHLKLRSISIRLAPAPFTPTYTACGLTPSTMTEAQMAGCLNPMYAAMVSHFHTLGVSIVDFTGFHEPTGMWYIQTGQIFSHSDVAAFVTSYSSTVKGAAGGSGINIGVGVAYSENGYVTYLIANLATSVLQFFGVDLYGTSSAANYATVMGTYANYCSEALAGGFGCKADESAPPVHCPSSAPVCNEDAAYEACGWAGWQTYGLNQVWNALLPKWAAAYGFSYWTSFYSWTNAFLGASSSAGNCNPSSGSLTGYPGTVMANLGVTTQTGTSYRLSRLWPAVSLQGAVALSGKVAIQ